MVNESINGPTQLNPVILKWVWYEPAVAGTGEAILEGQAVCFNFNYGTATDPDARRVNHVEKPTTSNAQWFAGVSARAYTAASGNYGRFIEIYAPGSVCLIHLNAGAPSTVVGQGLLTFDLTSGYEGQFLRTGMPGAGSAIPLESTTTGTAQKCLALLQEGPQSGGVEYFEPGDVATFVAMVGGTTLLLGCSLSQDCVEEVVDGLVEGIRKRVAVVTTAFDTFQLQVDIENNDGVDLAGTGALAEVTMDAVGNNVTLEWKQGAWHNLGGSFTAEA